MRGLNVICVFCLCLCLAPKVDAQENSNREEARRLFLEGVEHFRGEDYPAALASFEASYQIRESKTVLYNIAMCQQALFRFPEAIDNFEIYLRRWSSQIDPERQQEVRSRIEQMQSRLFLLTIEVSVEGAEVLVDGISRGRSPLDAPIRLGLGSHRVEARLDGYSPATLEVSAPAPGSRTIRLEPEALSQTGTLTVEVDAPLAVLSINGEEVGSVPARRELDPGVYALEISAPGRISHEQEIRIATGQDLRLEIHLERREVVEPRRPFYRRWWFWTTVGVVVSGVVVGATVAATNDDNIGDRDVWLP